MKHILYIISLMSLLASRSTAQFVNQGILFVGAGTTVSTVDNFTNSAGATVTNNGIMSLGANVTNNGTFDAAQGELKLTGGSIQTISGSTGITSSTLTLQNSAAGQSIVLNVPLTVNQAGSFIDGILKTDATNLLILSDNAQIVGAGDASHVVGPVRKIGDDVFTFPLGNGTTYRPASIGPTGTTADAYTAQYVESAPSNSGNLAPCLSAISGSEYWQIGHTTGTGSAVVGLAYQNVATSSTITTSPNLRVVRYNGSLWEPISCSANGGTTSGIVLSDGVTGGSANFGAFTLGAQAPAPTITGFAATSTSVCVGSPITFTATVGNFTGNYGWSISKGGPPIGSPGPTTSTSFSTVVTASGSGVQTYTLTVTSGGQITTAIATLMVNALPVATLTSNFGGTLTCAQTSLTLTAGGGTSYAFGGSGIVSQNASSGTAIVNASGIYSVTVSSSGCFSSTTISISQDSNLPTVSINPSSATLSCASPTVSLTAVGSGTYVWSTGATSQNISVTSAGTYSVTVTGGNGCTATASAQVSQGNSVLNVSIAATPSLTIATGQSATLTASGATSYQWSNGANSNPIVVSSPGLYSVTGTTGSCTGQASVTIYQTTPPAGPFAITAVTANTCQQIAANRYVISFTPVYVGTNGQPISFSVVNELFPTTAPGPYTLQLYADNPVITLKAQQGGTPGEVSYLYNWLTACTSPQPNTPPRVNQPLTDQIAKVGEGFGYTIPQVTFTDNESPQSLVLSVSGLPAGLSFSPPTQIGGVASVTGVSTVTVTATDPQGLSVSTSFVLTVVEPTATNTPPTLANPIPAQVGIQGQPFGLNVGTTYTDAQTPNGLLLSASGLPAGLNLVGTIISGTPSVSGTSTVSLTAVDPGGLSATTSFMLTIQPASVTASAPFAITGVSPLTCTQVANNRYEISFQPRYSGLNGQPINFWVVNELLPTTAPGPYSLQLYNDNPTIVLKARQDGSPGESTFSYNWLATCSAPQPNTPPRVTIPLTNQVAKVGEGFGYTIPQTTFTDNETPQSLALSVSGLPAGLSFSPPVQIGGVPSASGVSSVTVTATDPGGLSVSTQFSLTVLPAGTPSGFAITSVQTLSCVSVSGGRRSVTFTPQYSGLNGNPVSFSIVNELLPTTAPGPYTLSLYPDNPVLRLRAQQGGALASYDYNWLASCNSPGRQGVAEAGTSLQVKVLNNPVEGSTVEIEVRGVAGTPLVIKLVSTQGVLRAQQAVEEAGSVNYIQLPMPSESGIYFLQVKAASEIRVVKVLRR